MDKTGFDSAVFLAESNFYNALFEKELWKITPEMLKNGMCAMPNWITAVRVV
jgi:hypothetical protein